MNHRAHFSLPFFASLLALPAFASPEFRPGEVWPAVDGAPIQAHGGGVLVRSNIYYWYGEDRGFGARGSVSCYSSTNLYDWKYESSALPREAVPRIDGIATFVERPKVIFNSRTGKYVMWMHLEQRRYQFARAGIAISDSPTGPFTFVKAIRPVKAEFQFEPNDPNHEREFGGTFRDMNLFVDDDGRAYAFYASEGNWTMYVVRLDSDFTGPEMPMVENQTWSRIYARKMREAPAPFKFKGRYYLITSGCTGWNPNEADLGVADNILGPYESKGNPCVGPEAKTTFRSQSTSVLPVPGAPGQFIFMADRWNPQQLGDSRYLWLPLTLKPDGAVSIEWRDRWDLSVFSAP